MSRVGKLPVKLASGVKVDIRGDEVRVEGPKGKLSHRLPKGVAARLEGSAVVVSADEALPGHKALHGFNRTQISNMVHGVSHGFSKELEIIGVGYRAQTKGNVLTLNVGYSHPIDYRLPEGILAKVDNNTRIILSGADKMLVGMVAAKIRSFKEPEPYQGKGIRYVDEVIVRKQGKAAGAK